MQVTTDANLIVNRGRGPEIAGTRITVFDVMDYLKHGWHRDRIAAMFRLSSRDVQAAIDYIEAHREDVEAEYQGILERHRSYRYPPDVQAKVDRCRQAAERRLAEIHRPLSAEERDAQDHGRPQCGRGRLARSRHRHARHGPQSSGHNYRRSGPVVAGPRLRTACSCPSAGVSVGPG